MVMPTRSFATTASLLFLFTIFAVLTAHAQFRSSIEGSVTDPSGGVVSDAQVVLANVDTGVTLTAKTNSAGQYSFPSLPPGKYTITVTARGFSSVKQENITLGGAEIRTVPFALKVGDVSETVTITSDPTP